MNTVSNKMCRSGAALLVVLFIVMAATILSLGFITSSDIELACGQNMALKAQMDSLAESGLVYARGLLLNPQDVGTEYWAGAEGRQLVSGSSDYYDVSVTPDLSDHCNYIIDCNAYRLKDGQKVGRSNLRAKLRFDSCIAFWAGASTTLANSIVINGDVYCGGSLTSNAHINGDVFADGVSGSGTLVGQHYSAADAGVSWPGNVISIDDLKSGYYYDASGPYSAMPLDANNYSGSGSWPSAGGSNPKKVYYYDPVGLGGNLELGSDVYIEGTLIVDANLVITGNGSRIIAEKNFPALLVSGQLIIRECGGLDIDGLAVITQAVTVDSNAVNFSMNIHGGLFIQNGGLSAPASGTQLINISASPQKTAIRKWPSPPGDPMDWSQASGAFFKSITMF